MSKSTPILNISEDDLDSDEDPYANESFENESDQDILEVSEGESDSDKDSDVLPPPPMAKDSSILNAARLHARNKPIKAALVPFDSSSDDDVVISQTIAEINTKSMRLEDTDSMSSDKAEDETLLDQSRRELEVLTKHSEVDDTDEEGYTAEETTAIEEVKVTKIVIKPSEHQHRHRCQKHRQMDLVRGAANKDRDPNLCSRPHSSSSVHQPKHSNYAIVDQQPDIHEQDKHHQQRDRDKWEHDRKHENDGDEISQNIDSTQEHRRHHENNKHERHRPHEDDKEVYRHYSEDVKREYRRNGGDDKQQQCRIYVDGRQEYHRYNGHREDDNGHHADDRKEDHRRHSYDGNQKHRRHPENVKQNHQYDTDGQEDSEEENSHHAIDHRRHSEDIIQKHRPNSTNGKKEYRHQYKVGGQEHHRYYEDSEEEKPHGDLHKLDQRRHSEDGNQKHHRHPENGKQGHRHQYEDSAKEHRRHYEEDKRVPRRHYEADSQEVGKQEYPRHYEDGKQEHRRHHNESKKEHRRHYEDGGQEYRRRSEDDEQEHRHRSEDDEQEHRRHPNEGKQEYHHYENGNQEHRRRCEDRKLEPRHFEDVKPEHRQNQDERLAISKSSTSHEGRLGQRALPHNLGLGNYRHPHGPGDGLSTVTEADTEAEIDFEILNQSSLRYKISSRTPTSYNSDMAMHINLVKRTQSEKLNKNKNLRKSYSFSNEQMRDIERTNKILLRKILTQKPTYSANPQKAKSNTKVTAQSSSTNLTTAAINRKKMQRQIDLDNLSLKRRIEAISERRRQI